MLTFYWDPVSSNSQRVQLFLEYAQIPHTAKLVDLSKGEQTNREYLAINPFSAVPAIDDNGFHLAESNAILVYLAQQFDVPDVYPQDLKKRVVVDQMIHTSSFHLSRWVQAIFWHTILAPMLNFPTNQNSLDEAKGQLDRYLPRLERWLEKQKGFLCGSMLTIADFSFIPLVAQAHQMKLDWSQYKAVQKYTDNVLAIPAWKKTEEINRGFLASWKKE